MSTFVRGTLLLTGVIFFSKCLGFFYRMQFMRVAGEEVVGIYMTVYPAFIFFISLTQLGLPIAISKIVANYAAKGQLQESKNVMYTALRISTIAILILLPLLALSIPYLSTIFLQNEQTRYPLIVAVYTVPIVVYSGVIRAYLLGLSKIAPTAWSSVLEQAIRIICISFILPILLTNSNEMNAAYAMLATAAGEAVALFYLYIRYSLLKLPKHQRAYPTKPLFRIALPSAGSKLFGTFTWFLEPIVFLKALTLAGLGAATATTLYGIVSGVYIPLLLFPAFIPAALSIVLIPAISNAAAIHNNKLLNERISISLRLCTLVGCYAATFFLLYGDFLAYKLFHLTEQTNYMQLLAPIFYFYYIQSPLLSILQALDKGNVAMMNSIYGGIGKLILMLLLAAQPFLQTYGAVMAIGFGVLLTSFLHIASLRNMKNVHIGFRLFATSYICFIITSTIQSLVTYDSMIWSVVLTMLILTFSLAITRQLKWTDFKYLRILFARF